MLPLYKAALATAFAGSRQPAWRSSLVHLGALAFVALGLSFCMAQLIGQLPQDLHLSATVVTMGVVLVIQLVVLATLLAAASLGTAVARGPFARWVITLPLRNSEVWASVMLPSVLLAIFATMLVSWPLASTALQLGAPLPVLLVAMAAGTASGLGLRHGLPRRLIVSHALLVPTVIGIEYQLLSLLSRPAYSEMRDGIASIIYVLLIGLLVWAFIYSQRYLHATVTQLVTTRHVAAQGLPTWLWFAKKMLRTPARVVSFAAAIGMSGLAVAYANRYATTTTPVVLLTSIVIATYITDIRGLSLRQAPPEIAQLKGTPYFFAIQLATTAFFAALLALPLLWLNGLSLAMAIPLLACGLASGVCAGTIVVPRPGDILSQCIATILCIASFIALGALPIWQTAAHWQVIIPYTWALALVLLSFWIEFSRNRFIWSAKHHAQ
jgi:hypothetical protein